MTAPAFPVSQLGRPTVNYSLKPADLRVRADTVSGLASSYNGSNAALTTISVKWEWGADNYAVFQDWYRNDCKDGSIEFTIAEMYLFGSMGGLTARFTAPPKATYKAWNHYSVSATLETRTTDYIAEATLDAALPTDPHTDNVTWPSDLFGYPSGDGYGEQAQSSSLRGKTEGYARPAMRRNSPITVTQVPVKWEMSQANKILFDAWYHYKLVDGAAWFWIYTQFHGVWQYIKVRFVESISVEYESVDWWQVSGTLETVEYNYLPLADCPTLVAPNEVPTITWQPSDVVASDGDVVTFSVVAGGALPRTIEWYYGSTKIDGATSTNYSFTITTTNFGAYHCVVTNDYGSITSSTANALLTPAITEQPEWDTVQTGGTTSATVVAVGSGTLSYQWYKDDLILSGYVSPTITIENAQTSNAGKYYCVISSEYGSVQSNDADLIVNFYLTVREDVSVAASLYFSDVEDAVSYTPTTEYASVDAALYFSDTEDSLSNTPPTESLTVGASLYFLDIENV